MVSVRSAITKRLGRENLNEGFLKSLLNKFYLERPESFPYSRTVLSIIRALDWPEHYEQIEEYPDQRNPGWGEELQGITNDGANWYVSQRNRLWKFPFEHDLNEDIDSDDPRGGIRSVGIPDLLTRIKKGDNLYQYYNHIGDIDCRNNLIYVPLEGNLYEEVDGMLIEGNRIQGRIAVFNSENLDFVSSSGLVAENGTEIIEAAWCAVNPLNGLLYTSSSNKISIYKTELNNNQLILTFLGHFELKFKSVPLDFISGGSFSTNGHLYLTTSRAFFAETNKNTLVRNDGLYGFDMITGNEMIHKVIPYEPRLRDSAQELEGLTIVDLDSTNVPNIKGQIHVMLLDNELLTDDQIYFKHFRITDKNKV